MDPLCKIAQKSSANSGGCRGLHQQVLPMKVPHHCAQTDEGLLPREGGVLHGREQAHERGKTK
jgi:hypothetical protein